MIKIHLNPTRITLKTPIIRQKTTHKQRDGTQRTYTKYSATFPRWYIELYNTGKDIYLYQENQNTYIAPSPPLYTDDYTHLKIQLLQHYRKHNQLTEKINLPIRVLQPSHYNTVTYTYYPDSIDPATHEQGKLQLTLTKTNKEKETE